MRQQKIWERQKHKMSAFELIVLNRLERTHIQKPEIEYKFHTKRRWRFDFAWPIYKIAIECEGGTWIRGRHTRGLGYQKDLEKYNAAAAAGWKVFRYSPAMIDNIVNDVLSVMP